MSTEEKEFTIKYKAKISAESETDFMLWYAEPQDSAMQEIVSFETNLQPTETYTDDQGNKIHFLTVKNEKEVNFEMNITALLTKEVDTEVSFNNPTDERRFLKDEKYLMQTPEIAKLWGKISGGKYRMTTASEIFEYVAKNFEYEWPVQNRGVENLNLEKLVGDCGEYSALLVTLLRMSDIPARDKSGYVLFPEENSVAEHGWAEAMTDQGWKNFDANYASQEESFEIGKKLYFGNQPEYRLSFVDGFNIPLKPTVPKDFNFDFWTENGLPATNDSVQILQPTFFATKSNVEFEEEIELI